MARDIRVAILGDSRDFSRAVRSVQGDARKLNDSFDGIGRGAARMGRAVTLAVGAVAAGGLVLAKGFIDAATESQKVTKQTAAVIKSMGNAANVTAEEVAALSTQLSMQTGIDDELIQSGQNILLTFGKIRNGTAKNAKVFDRATEAALNMSVALGTDMKSAAMLVGKALNDPIRGLTAMRRSGIQFTKQQEDQIKWMVASGNVMGAQLIMLKELDAQFGGSAAAQATAGEKLRVVWGNIQEQLGEKLLPVFNAVAEWLSARLPAAMQAVEPHLSAIAGWFSEAARVIRETVAPAVAAFLSDQLESLRAWWATNGPAIKQTAGSLMDQFNTHVLPIIQAGADLLTGTLLPAFAAVATWFVTHESAIKGVAAVIGVTLVAAYVRATAAAVASATASTAAWLATLGPLGRVLVAITAIKTAMDELIPDGKKTPGGILEPFKGMSFDLPGGNPLNLLPKFDNGGIMPGPRGEHSLALVAGGETVLPTHKQPAAAQSPFVFGEGSIVLNGVRDEQMATSVARELRSLIWQLGAA